MTIITMTSDNLLQRDWYLDALKGIGIFLMIIGHVVSPIRDVIFSFHMPLFFFISGYLYKDRTAKDIIKRNAKKVLLPYVVTCLFIWLLLIIKGQNWLWGISIILANGTDTVWGIDGMMVGPLWFLVCYVVAVLGFHYVLKIKNKFFQLFIILSMWVVAYIIKRLFGLQPLDVLNSVPAICCLWMGYCLKDEQIKKIVFSKGAFWVGSIIWVICILYGKLSMAGLVYRLWIIQMVGAFYATALLYNILKFNGLNRGGQLLAYIGRMSIVVLCVHSVDYILGVSNTIVSHLNLSNVYGVPLNMILKLLIAFIGTIIIKKMPIVNRVFI